MPERHRECNGIPPGERRIDESGILAERRARWRRHGDACAAALALGAQKLLPAPQQTYNGWASPAGTKGSLRFVNVGFRYTPDGPSALEGVNLTIPTGARVGFVGSTGGGKSTAVDILMDLLEPTTGQLLVADQPVAGRGRSWHRTIAHVPQTIFLAGTALAENIAFGVPREAIDMERVRQAARQAHIEDFINLRPEGYETRVGERGIRLSGGQRQRIGIACALYEHDSVLVFDEATDLTPEN